MAPARRRIFFRSLEAAIFLFSRVARIPEGTHVLPVICTEERITLGAELEDGTVVRGQNEISHPTPSGSSAVDKATTAQLPSRVKRIFYLSSDGDHQEHEVFPTANPQASPQPPICKAPRAQPSVRSVRCLTSRQRTPSRALPLPHCSAQARMGVSP